MVKLVVEQFDPIYLGYKRFDILVLIYHPCDLGHCVRVLDVNVTNYSQQDKLQLSTWCSLLYRFLNIQRISVNATFEESAC